MKFILSLCLLLGVALDFGTAAAFGEKPRQAIAAQQKVARAAGDGGQSNSMTVAFVPLISIIANLLPRFFTRYATASPASAQQARSINIWEKEEELRECQKPVHVGMKLPDELSPIHYYQCHLSKECFDVEKKICFQVKRHLCQPQMIFNFEKQKCVLLHFPM